MANALHATLSSHQRRRLHTLRHDPDLKPRERDRVEALLLSADGMRVPQLAAHFDCRQAAWPPMARSAPQPTLIATVPARARMWPGARRCAGP